MDESERQHAAMVRVMDRMIETGWLKKSAHSEGTALIEYTDEGLVAKGLFRAVLDDTEPAFSADELNAFFIILRGDHGIV